MFGNRNPNPNAKFEFKGRGGEKRERVKGSRKREESKVEAGHKRLRFWVGCEVQREEEEAAAEEIALRERVGF